MGFRPAFKKELPHIAWIIYCPFFVHELFYTTETLGKELKKEQRIFFTKGLQICKGFTNKNFKYIPVDWDKRQAKLGKLMFMANHTIVYWGPHGMWLSNCSDDINSLCVIMLLK